MTDSFDPTYAKDPIDPTIVALDAACIALDATLALTALRLGAFAQRLVPMARRRRVRTLVAAVAVLVVGASGATATVVSHIVRVGGVEIQVNTAPTPTPLQPTTAAPTPAEWPGEPVTLEEARRRFHARIRLPRTLGAPRSAYWMVPPSTGQVTTVWSTSPTLPATSDPTIGALLTQFRGTTSAAPIMKKVAGSGTTVEPVTVNGHAGWWLSGAGHSVAIVDASGTRIEPARLAKNTMLWSQGDITFRLEINVNRNEALRIARTVS